MFDVGVAIENVERLEDLRWFFVQLSDVLDFAILELYKE